MGASKEGTMSVRDKINSVLQEAIQDDPTETESSEVSNVVPISKSQNNVPVPLSFITPQNYIKRDTLLDCAGQGQQQQYQHHHNQQQQHGSGVTTMNSGGNSGILTPGNLNNVLEESNSHSQNNVGWSLEDFKFETDEDDSLDKSSVTSDASSNNANNTGGTARRKKRKGSRGGHGNVGDILKQNLLQGQSFLLKLTSEKLKIAEERNEVLEKEKNQIQSNLESQRKEHESLLEKYVRSEEQRSQFEARIQGQQETILGQHETIKSHQETIRKLQEKNKEWERELAILKGPKVQVSNKETCTSPVPQPPPTQHQPQTQLPQQQQPPIQTITVAPPIISSDFVLGKMEVDEEDAPQRKKVRLDAREYSPMSSHLAYQRRMGQENQPGKGNTLDGSSKAGRLISNTLVPSRKFFCPEVEDDLGPDEFGDELARINKFAGGNVTGYGHGIGPLGIGDGVGKVEGNVPQRYTSSSTSAFDRPWQKKAQPKFFISNSNVRRPNTSNSSRYTFPASKTTSNVPKSSSSVVNQLNSTSSSSISPGLKEYSLRNNFLDLSRPKLKLQRKSQFASFSFEESPTSTTSTPRFFRSLDPSATSSHLHHHHHLQGNNVEDIQVSSQHTSPSSSASITPTKRPPGRPPGSLSRLKTRLPTSSSSSIASSSRLNGTEEPSPPQRFSMRGRLLKPNRSRFSPEPDAPTVSTTPKMMTTRKNYHVTEPFLPEGLDLGTLGTGDGTTLMGMEDTGSKGAKEDVTEEDPASVVEVPRWRLITLKKPVEEEEPPVLEDDMSDEAFLKRHQKLETKEKQRKRWDSQRLREESYLERLKRKQEERERQKELRRQQRKRNRGRSDVNEEESVMPSAEDIKAIYVSEELPVGAFGHSLPIVEKVPFQVCWTPPPEDLVGMQSPLNILIDDDSDIYDREAILSDEEEISEEKVEDYEEYKNQDQVDYLDSPLSTSSSPIPNSPQPPPPLSEDEGQDESEEQDESENEDEDDQDEDEIETCPNSSEEESGSSGVDMEEDEEEVEEEEESEDEDDYEDSPFPTSTSPPHSPYTVELWENASSSEEEYNDSDTLSEDEPSSSDLLEDPLENEEVEPEINLGSNPSSPRTLNSPPHQHQCQSPSQSRITSSSPSQSSTSAPTSPLTVPVPTVVMSRLDLGNVRYPYVVDSCRIPTSTSDPSIMRGATSIKILIPNIGNPLARPPLSKRSNLGSSSNTPSSTSNSNSTSKQTSTSTSISTPKDHRNIRS